MKLLIVGDIGGTKTNLALFAYRQDDFQLLHFATFPSQHYSLLDDIIIEFCSQNLKEFDLSQIVAATFAIAGPIQEGKCKATNLPWIVDAETLKKKSGIKQIYLINDLEASAYALEVLPVDQLYCVQKGKKGATGNRAVVSPGTGLGEAGIYYDERGYHPFASEGGHVEFGPQNERQMELCKFILGRFGHVSYERLLSGPGLQNIYHFLQEQEKMEIPTWLQERMQKEDPAKVISEEALKMSCQICVDALSLFLAILAAEASNCVLKFMAMGGLYIGGGIAPKILPKLKEALFIENFLDKGRFRALLETVPIYVILDDKASLLGACYYCKKKVH